MRRWKQGPATHGRILPQSTDNARTGLNRDSFGTVASPPPARIAGRQPPEAMRPTSSGEPCSERRWPPSPADASTARISSALPHAYLRRFHGCQKLSHSGRIRIGRPASGNSANRCRQRGAARLGSELRCRVNGAIDRIWSRGCQVSDVRRSGG